MFAWSSYDMSSIDLNIICHRLHVNPANKPGRKGDATLLSSELRSLKSRLTSSYLPASLKKSHT
ncbi:hypothetical protein GBA52_024611 [Prunus armeniaca]|nr:hypothetical protein GBA52_024611 [Prunus armeniaca]